MSPQNLTNVYNQNPTLQSQYTLQQYLDLFGGGSTPTTPPTTPPATPPNQGIIGSNINQYQTGGGGGGGNNPYMPNANVNTNYQPNYDYRQHIDYNPNLSSTANQKQFDMYQNYYNKPAPSGIAKAINTGINMIPGIGTIKRGVEFVGNTLGKYMPVNQRGIFENELRGSGVFTDDIGRIAIGPGGSYNTPEGIMAGYNANQMTDKTFDKRTETITETLGSKYGITDVDDIQGIIDGTITDEDIEAKYGIKTNLTSNLYNINLAKTAWQKNKKKAQDIYDFEVEKKKQAAIEAAAAKSRAESKKQYDPNKHGPNNYGLGSDGKQSYDSGQGFGVNATTGGPVSNKTGKGRTDWAKGGFVRGSYFDGGIVSLRRR